MIWNKFILIVIHYLGSRNKLIFWPPDSESLLALEEYKYFESESLSVITESTYSTKIITAFALNTSKL